VKAFLMHEDRDIDPASGLPVNAEMLVQDLELDTIFNAMALGDPFLFDVAKRTILLSMTDPKAVAYRQQLLADCLEHPAIVKEIYGTAVEALLAERKIWSVFLSSPESILHRSIQAVEVFLNFLKRLRKISDENSGSFRSAGFVRFFEMINTELDDEYFRIVERHLSELKFHRGVLISAQLGRGNTGTNYVLRRTRERNWFERISPLNRAGYSFEVAARDEAGSRAMGELRDRGLNLVANALAQSADHILSFFAMLKAELAFYIGCLNLQARLSEKGEPTCFPVPHLPGDVVLSAEGLYDLCLSLNLKERVVGNDVHADGKWLVMITGANQGGKSTFLRSVGVAQLMMQSGMFVPARSFRANVCDGVFTHYKREEDPSMRSGKFDEELGRMSFITHNITQNSVLLCNESLAATNEREGSEIARQVTEALTEARIKVLFVTHMFDLAHGLYIKGLDSALFLRAERLPDGGRTFKLVEGEPLPTSYGEDSYEKIFGVALPGAG